MKFLIDAHLPPRLAGLLTTRGHDAIHSDSLPAGNTTQDSDICVVADAQGRAVVTKDKDFIIHHRSQGRLQRLLHLAAWNTSRAQTLALFSTHIDQIAILFATHDHLTLTNSGVVPSQ